MSLVNWDKVSPPTWADLQLAPSAQPLVYADLEANEMRTISLRDWVIGAHSTASHRQRSLMMYGGAGAGKTPVSLLLARELSKAYQSRGFAGRVFNASEPEALPRVEYSEGDVVVLQEFAPARPRGASARAMSLDDVKNLTDVVQGGDVTGKGSNTMTTGIISFGRGVVRVFTCNCEPHGWCSVLPQSLPATGSAELAALSADARAVLKRLVFWPVAGPLLTAAALDRHRTADTAGARVTGYFTGVNDVP